MPLSRYVADKLERVSKLARWLHHLSPPAGGRGRGWAGSDVRRTCNPRRTSRPPRQRLLHGVLLQRHANTLRPVGRSNLKTDLAWIEPHQSGNQLPKSLTLREYDADQARAAQLKLNWPWDMVQSHWIGLRSIYVEFFRLPADDAICCESAPVSTTAPTARPGQSCAGAAALGHVP